MFHNCLGFSFTKSSKPETIKIKDLLHSALYTTPRMAGHYKLKTGESNELLGV